MLRVALLLICLSVASRQLNLSSWNAGGVTILWPSNAFLLGVMLCSPKRQWAAFLAVASIIDLFINFSLGNSPFICAYVTGCNMLEAAMAAVLLWPILAHKPDLTERKQFFAFLLYGVVVAPAFASFLAAFFIDGHFKQPTLHDFHRWFTADALGMAIVTPLYLAFSHRDRFADRTWREIVALFAMLTAVTLAVFGQTRYPLLFVVLPCLLFLGVRLGLAGSALGLLLVSIVGGFLTAAGHGPMDLIQATSPSERDLVFQLFIAVSMLLLYGIEVLRAESRRLQAGLRGSERRFRLLAEASSDIIVLSDLNGRRRYISPAVTEIPRGHFCGLDLRWF